MFKLAIFGNPVEQSRSPELHQAFALQAQLSIDYQKITVSCDFAQAVRTFIDKGGHGFNITSPCKFDAFQLATKHSTRAKLAQAVNTLIVRPNGELWGDNTDGVGFVHDLTINKGFTVANKVIVIHGAGGAVRGLIPALFAQNPKQIWLINRTLEKGLALAKEFLSLGVLQAVPYGHILSDVDLLVDGSSFDCQQFAGLKSLQFTDSAWAYDLKYANAMTPFIQWAKARGINNYTDGFGMLVEQAAVSFFLWTGFSPETKRLLT